MAISSPLRVGLFGIGLEAYWPQFEGLKPRLEGYLSQVAGKLGRLVHHELRGGQGFGAP